MLEHRTRDHWFCGGSLVSARLVAVFIAAFFMVFLIVDEASALTAEKVWVKSIGRGQSLRVIDPTQSPPRLIPVQISAGFLIDNPYMLNESGQRYRQGRGERPFEVRGAGRLNGIYIGFDHSEPGQVRRLLAIHVDDVSTSSPQGPVAVYRTPIVRSAPNPARPLLALPKGMDNLQRVVDLIYEFHNRDCESQRIADSKSASIRDEIDALFAEWSKFVSEKAKKGDRERYEAELARQVDIVARTIAFEGHGLGALEREQDPARGADSCQSADDCPISACEQRILALSIRNRASAQHCSREFGCRTPGDFIGVATKPDQFNIWMPSLAHPALASCFLHDGVTSRQGLSERRDPQLDLYLARSRQFQFAIEASARLLFGQSAEWGIESSDSDVPTEALTHYYHPRGMGGCDPDEYDRRYRLGAVYARTETGPVDFHLMLSQTVLAPLGSLAPEIPAQVLRNRTRTERLEAERRGEKNLSYVFEPFVLSGDSRGWVIPTERLSLITSSNVCLPSGLAVMGVDRNRCSSILPHYFRAPRWGYESGARQMRFSCQFENGSRVELGGPCDVRIQPVAVFSRRSARTCTQCPRSGVTVVD